MAELCDTNSLAAKRILLIRPQRQEDQLLSMLENSGADVTHIPVMRIEPIVESQQIKTRILEVDNFHKAIFVSGNAAELGIEWIDKFWPMLPVGIEYFAVGERTAALLKEADINALCPSGRQNSETLLQLTQLQELDNQRIIIFRGVGGREILAETLTERGAR
ncbi:MAG: uroporphyrinogen-III synthase, partial [Porticoccaceae bacterium]